MKVVGSDGKIGRGVMFLMFIFIDVPALENKFLAIRFITMFPVGQYIYIVHCATGLTLI